MGEGSEILSTQKRAVALRAIVAVAFVRSCPPEISLQEHLYAVKSSFSLRRANSLLSPHPLYWKRRVIELEQKIEALQCALDHRDTELDVANKRRKSQAKPIAQRLLTDVKDLGLPKHDSVLLSADTLAYIRHLTASEKGDVTFEYFVRGIRAATHLISLGQTALSEIIEHRAAPYLTSGSAQNSIFTVQQIGEIVSWAVQSVFAFSDDDLVLDVHCANTELHSAVKSIIHTCIDGMIPLSVALHRNLIDHNRASPHRLNSDTNIDIRSDLVLFLTNMCSALPLAAELCPQVILCALQQLHEICQWATTFCATVCDIDSVALSTTSTRQQQKASSNNTTAIFTEYVHLISRKEVILLLCKIIPLGITYYPFDLLTTKIIAKLVSDIVRMAYNAPSIDIVFGYHYSSRIVSSVFPYAA